MGKITQKTIDREEAPKPSRKRRKKELDKIHSKILKAKRKLDNVEKGKDRQRNQGRAKICNRLLPKLDAGIYRNGTKSKDIWKAETSENIFEKARLNADALKLFNGDTSESKYIIEISSDDETAKQSPNKSFVKHSLEWTLDTLEQSPVLAKGQCQNHKVCIKKKGEDNVFQKIDPNKMRKQKINDELKYVVQKEDVCKRKLFQNNKEQLTNKVEAITTQSQMCDNTDQTKDNRENEKKIEQSCSKDSETESWDPLIRYTEFCKIISAEHFESNLLKNYPDPVTTTLQKLRHAYTDNFRQKLLREKNKQELTSVESPAVSVEYQACTSSNVSQFSPVEFEVPKCTENHTIATRLQDVFQKNNKSHFIQNADFQKSICSGITLCSSTSSSTQNTVTYDTNSFIVENQENNDNHAAKQSSGINRLPRPASFCFVNEKNPIHLDSQRISKHISHSSNNNWNKDNFYIDISDHRNAQCIDNAKYLKNFIFTSDSVLPTKGHLSKDNFHEKLSTDNYLSKDTLSKCDDKANMKNVKRPTILHRFNVISKNNHSVQINDDCPEDLHKKSTINLFDKTPDRDIDKEFYETEFPNMFKNLATPSINARDRSKLLESPSELMEMKNTRESQVDEFDINICPDELSRRNRFSRFDKSLHSQALETSCDTNAYPEKSCRQEQIASNTRKHLHSNYRPINYLQRANLFNIDVESAKRMQQTTQQAKLQKREANNTSARDQNQNILFNDVNDTPTIPTAALSFSQKVQSDRKSRESTCEETSFHVNCKKNQTNTCRCNEQYFYFDSAHCPRKYNMSQAQHFYEDTVQPKAVYNIKSYNNDTNNCTNQSKGVRNEISLLPVEQKHNPCMYLKVTDNQHRAMLLQNVTQPVKYLAVKNDSGIQRIPVYINDGKVAENVPLKVVTLVDSNTQPKAFPQEVVPLQTNNLQFDDFATHKTSNQFVVKHLNPVNTILLDPDSQSSSIWYASNL